MMKNIKTKYGALTLFLLASIYVWYDYFSKARDATLSLSANSTDHLIFQSGVYTGLNLSVPVIFALILIFNIILDKKIGRI